MLVDDDALLRDMYATKFTERGDLVETAETSAEALSKLEDNEFDVVLLDMIMPGLAGADLIKVIKTNEKAKDTACIVLSNQSEEADIEAAKAAGAVGYIIKAELVPSEVVDKVHELIKG